MIFKNYILQYIISLIYNILLITHAQNEEIIPICENPAQLTGIPMRLNKCEPLLKLLKNYGHRAKVGEFLRNSSSDYKIYPTNPTVCCPSSTYKDRSRGPSLPRILLNRMTFNSNETSEPPEKYRPLFYPECGTIDDPESLWDRQSMESIILGRYTGPGKIVNGRFRSGYQFLTNGQISKHVWPWMAILGYNTSGRTPSWGCAGSLISSRHVLTAAHCVYKQRHLFVVRLGELNLDPYFEDGATPVDIKIDRTHIHPGYNYRNAANDVALIRLNEDVPYTEFIRPICLPLYHEYWKTNYHPDGIYIAGWGALTWRGESATHLQEASIQMTETFICQNDFKNKTTAYSENVVIDDRVICAGGKTGVCSGDSGGPLMQVMRTDSGKEVSANVWYAIGISSFGFECATETPSIFANVSSYLDFILPLLV